MTFSGVSGIGSGGLRFIGRPGLLLSSGILSPHGVGVGTITISNDSQSSSTPSSASASV